MFRNQDTTPYIIVAIASGLVVVAILFIAIGNPFGTAQEITIRSLARQIAADEVASIVVQGQEVEARLSDGTRLRATLEDDVTLAEAVDEFGVSSADLQGIAVSSASVEGDEQLETFIFRAFPFFLPAALIMVTAAIVGLTVKQRRDAR
jgi:hypothetical protein